MICAWEMFLNLLPLWLRPTVDKYGRDALQELRLRMGAPPEMVLNIGSRWGDRAIMEQDISFCINAASKYSPWSASTVMQGYITAAGGHRLGLCGEVVVRDGQVSAFRRVNQICLRVARDFIGIAAAAADLEGSTLIVGPPGSGKSTLLRDLIRTISNCKSGSIAVVDERSELFPFIGDKGCFESGKRTDILTGCNKSSGIEMVLRTMGPSAIAVDEITAVEDCEAMIHAGWCGVNLFATAHAWNAEDLCHRPIYKVLTENGLFQNLIVLQKDKSWKVERMM